MHKYVEVKCILLKSMGQRRHPSPKKLKIFERLMKMKT